MATKFLEHFLYIARAMTDIGEEGIGLWDDKGQLLLRCALHAVRRESAAAPALDGRADPSLRGRHRRAEVIDKLPELWSKFELYRERRPHWSSLSRVGTRAGRRDDA